MLSGAELIESKFDKILGWVGCFLVCLGAGLTTFQIDPLNIYALNLGAIVYAIWGYRVKQWNQLAVNLFLIGVYGFGALWRML